MRGDSSCPLAQTLGFIELIHPLETHSEQKCHCLNELSTSVNLSLKLCLAVAAIPSHFASCHPNHTLATHQALPSTWAEYTGFGTRRHSHNQDRRCCTCHSSIDWHWGRRQLPGRRLLKRVSGRRPERRRDRTYYAMSTPVFCH